VHSIRKNNKIKVRTPLSRILLPVLDERFAARVRVSEEIIRSEVNVKKIEYIDDASGLLVKKVKPNFPRLGKQYGPKMKDVAAVITEFTQDEISILEKIGRLSKSGFEFVPDDVLISSEDIPGWSVANDGSVTVALDIAVTEELKREGIARDLVNRIQNLRKDTGLEVLDKITITLVQPEPEIALAIDTFQNYICNETQALSIGFVTALPSGVPLDMDDFTLVAEIKKSI
jgi:isoleucyl-tRNA synthetase